MLCDLTFNQILLLSVVSCPRLPDVHLVGVGADHGRLGQRLHDGHLGGEAVERGLAGAAGGHVGSVL